MTIETYRIAHINKQNQDVIIIPMSPSIGSKTAEQQNDIKQTIQACAIEAGLAGIVCLVWESGHRFNFLAPPQWHPYFKGLNMTYVRRVLNKTLTCTI